MWKKIQNNSTKKQQFTERNSVFDTKCRSHKMTIAIFLFWIRSNLLFAL